MEAESLILAKLDIIHQDVSILKTQMLAIGGNGQPGTLQRLERKIEKHEEQINKWKGALALMAFLVLAIGATEIWHILVNR